MMKSIIGLTILAFCLLIYIIFTADFVASEAKIKQAIDNVTIIGSVFLFFILFVAPMVYSFRDDIKDWFKNLIKG